MRTCECILGLVTALAPACSGDNPPRLALIDTLPEGTIRVTNGRQGVWSTGAGWSVEEVVRLGSAMGDDTLTSFGDVWATALDGFTRVYVLDRQAKQVRVFDSTGQFVRAFGRPGEGPGEFQNPIGMDWDASGNLWVVDARNQRYTVFDTTGTLLRTHRREIGGWGYAWGGGFSRAGELFEPTFYRDRATGESRRGYVRHAIDSAPGARDTAWLPTYAGDFFTIEAEGQRAMLGVPFAPALHWRFDRQDGLWFGVSDAYRLYHRTLAGDTVRVVTRETDPVPVSHEDRSALREQWAESPMMSEAHLARFLERVPDVKAAFRQIVVDSEGFVWVSRPGHPDTAGTPMDVFDRDGVFQGSLTLRLFYNPPPTVTTRYIVGIDRDDLGVEYVVLYRIIGR